MIALRRAVVEEARSWANPRTPFCHQARVKGANGGVDCLQLGRACGENVGALPVITADEEKRFLRYYGRRPDPPRMRECLETFLVEIPAEDADSGDLAWTHWGNDFPIHVSILADFRGRRTVIHSIWDNNPRTSGVHEQGMSDVFRSRVVAYWRYPALAEVGA